MSSERRPAPSLPIAACLLALLVVCAFHATLGGGVFYFMDFHQIFEPLAVRLRAALGDGGLLLYDQALANGRPVLANPIAGAAYPPSWAVAFAEPARALTALAVAHAYLGALGAWLLARRLGSSATAAWTCAVVFALSGPAVASIAAWNLARAAAWLPWTLLLLDRALDPGSRAPSGENAVSARPARDRLHVAKAALPLALVWALLLLTGEPFLIAPAAMGSVVLLAGRWRAGGLPVRALATGLLGIAIGAAAASPFLLAVVCYLPAAVRGGGFKPEGVLQWSFHPLEALGLAIPHAFGEPERLARDLDGATRLVPGRASLFFTGTYVGPLALGLAALGTLAGGARLGRARAASAAALAVLALLALGGHGPLAALLASPLLDSLRYPVKWLLPAMLPLALLAARGCDALAGAAPGGERRRALVVLGAALAVPGLVSLAAGAGLAERLAGLAGTSRPDVASAAEVQTRLLRGALVASAPLLLVLGALAARMRRCSALAATAVTLDLVLANSGLAPVVPLSFYRQVPRAVEAIRSDARGALGRLWVDADSLGRAAFRRPPRTTSERLRLQRELLEAYTPLSYGLQPAFPDDTEAFAPVPYFRLGLLAEGAPLRERLMLLGAAGVTHVTSFERYDLPEAIELAALDVGTDRPLRVYRNRLAQPRARVVGRLVAYSSEPELAARVRGADVDLFATAAAYDLADGPPPLPAGIGSEPGAGERHAQVIEDHGSRLRVETHGAGGWLVVCDTLTPGWSARVDGSPAPLFRADVAFLAVPVPPGDHRVELRYSPWRRPGSTGR